MSEIVGQECEIMSQRGGADQKVEVYDRFPPDMDFVRFRNVVVQGLSKGEQIHALWTYN